MHDLGEVSADAIRRYWHRNFMVDVDKPSEDMLKERKTGMWRRELVNWSCTSALYGRDVMLGDCRLDVNPIACR